MPRFMVACAAVEIKAGFLTRMKLVLLECSAANDEAAERKMLKTFNKLFPETDGYTGHSAIAKEIAEGGGER